jgi:DNA-binding Lrp family transcriptional regulator
MGPDATDFQILAILQKEGRVSNAELAQRVGLTPAPTLVRVNKLESAGYIRAYVAILDRNLVGLPVTAFVSVILRSHNRDAADAFLREVEQMPEILECHHIAGEEDYLLKVVAANPSDYETFVLEKLTAVAEVLRVKTTIVLSSPKTETAVPLK